MRLPRWLRSGRVIVGLILGLLLIGLAVAGPLLAPHDPLAQNPEMARLPIGWLSGGRATFPLGTDAFGRCIASRLLEGARIAALVALGGGGGAVLLGGLLACAAQLAGGRTDRLIGQALALWQSLPPVLLAAILAAGFGAGWRYVVPAVVLTDWARVCRALRDAMPALARCDHVAAARLLGLAPEEILLGEILPAMTPLLATLLPAAMGRAIVAEAALAVFGVGAGPDEVSWGRMIADAAAAVTATPFDIWMPSAPAAMWLVIAPTVAIVLAVAGCHLLGEGLRRSVRVRQEELGS
jgi:peptide/nickel transport system permease protein